MIDFRAFRLISPTSSPSNRSSKTSRRLVLGVIASTALWGIGCSHPAERALQGRWLGSSAENFDTDESAAANGWARGTSFEFAGSYLTVAVPAEEPRTGTYRVSTIEDQTVRLAVIDAEGEQSELELTFDSETTLRWHMGDGRAVVMNRQ